ncbi:MAG TPA: carboxypeptidase regulatory-like domain-containing protein [Thermoanaerobaculia bacterium]
MKAGKYAVLLAGTKPLQRKLFPIEVPERGEAEVVLSLEPFRLTGEVELRKKPLAATVSLDGDAWKTELETDQSGRFDAEVWSAGDYAVAVSAGALAEPYMVMKRVSPSDSHWRLVVPSRRITGRVFDAETGKPVTEVSLSVESTSGETRAQRTIAVKEDGTFVYPGAGDGQYTISALAKDYLASERVQLQARESDGDLTVDLPLVRGVQVRVAVVDPQGVPIARALVLTEFTPEGSVSRMTRTDADGVATVAVPEKGERTIYVVPADASFAVATVTGRDAASGVRIVVPAGVATLRIRTTSTDDQPLPGISVNLRHAGRLIPNGVLSSMAQARKLALATDAAGELTIPVLPAGDYELAWKRRGSPPDARRWTRVTLAAGETRVTQTFASTTTGR